MKQILIVILLLATLLAAVACGKKDNPESVADAFLTALEKQDFEGAKKYATTESEAMLAIIQSFMSQMKEEDMGKYSHKIISSTVDGDSAQVTYETWSSLTPEERETQDLKMVKVDGVWKASLEKGEMAK